MELEDYAILVALSGIWGASFLFIKVAVGQMPAPWVSFGRSLAGAASLIIVLLLSRVSLSSLPMGSTITLRFLMQAPLIVLDLEGNPTAVMDTFLEEYHWTLVDSSKTVGSGQ